MKHSGIELDMVWKILVLGYKEDHKNSNRPPKNCSAVSAFSQCSQQVLSASALSKCSQRGLSASALSEGSQRALSASALSECSQRVLSASALSICCQQLLCNAYLNAEDFFFSLFTKKLISVQPPTSKESNS